ncbi:MAG: DUF302 domain-containing protein [Leptospiraceae bacterium]|nr:DUF302 domain-containing protein [Leptospiraceae bacterium]
MSYAFTTELNCTFAEAESRCRDRLAAKGFGVLTEIDVSQTLKKKIDVEFRPYKILGACNPPFAHRILQHDGLAGLMLPCNFVIQQQADGIVQVAAVDPVASLQAVTNAGVQQAITEIQAVVRDVIESL